MSSAAASSVRFAPGMHVLVRDEAWRVRRVERSPAAHSALGVVGLSPLVRDQEAWFSTEFDTVQILDPRETELVLDTSSAYRRGLLHIESHLRRIPPVDGRLYVGHKAALDPMSFQLQPAALALSRPQRRILIADAVGLGKTLEAGILLSELIARGEAQRILVVALKSLLTQLQKELWSRFTIPLVRLDSAGLQRIRQRIPVDHNPFQHFDKAIVSIDTLKQNNAYRRYLEQARWDVIVIDEAHNVARRGARSLRNRLAALLATRSDTLIMLSATPHDGKAQTFASLVNMLDPTAIADEHSYTADDIKHLYIRRFKKDVGQQLSQRLPPRAMRAVAATASPEEEAAYDAFVALDPDPLAADGGAGRGGQRLFKTTLEKSLLSSPAACIDTVDTRLKTLAKRPGADLGPLQAFRARLEAITPARFAKHQRLLALLREIGWDGSATRDRLVIFTERIPTMRWLAAQLVADLGLPREAVATLHGGMSDTDQQAVVEDFSKERAPVRVLVASDVASEGINLHYLCHRMVHFDVPWSLMVFQQRNGRIDRYGQQHPPELYYMLTEAQNAKLNGDKRVLEILIEKDQQVQDNIGDPSVFTGVATAEEEEAQTARAIERGDPEAFLRDLDSGGLDLGLDGLLDDLDGLDGDGAPATAADAPGFINLGDPSGHVPPVEHGELLSLYEDDFAFLQEALEALEVDMEADPQARRLSFEVPEGLRRRFARRLPAELALVNNRVILTADDAEMKRSIEEARREESAWPSAHYLWRLHPVLDWAQDKHAAYFGRHSAPVLRLPPSHAPNLAPDAFAVVVSGLLPNRKSQPVVHRWFAACFDAQRAFTRLEPFDAFVQRTGLSAQDRAASPMPNDAARPFDADLAALRRDLLPRAVAAAEDRMRGLRDARERDLAPQLDAYRARLDALRAKQLDLLDGLGAARRDAQQRRVQGVFDAYTRWIEDAMTLAPDAFVQIIALVCV